MSKPSKRVRARLHQSGLGGGRSVVAWLPAGDQRLATLPDRDPGLEFRLRCVEYARWKGVRIGPAASSGAPPPNGPF